VNQVEDVYNGFGQLTKEYQEHSGAVNTGSSLYVGYDYDTTGANDSRLTAMIYPNGRQLDYVYNSGLDSDISRIRALADDGGSDAGTIQSYTYLGLNTIVQETDGNGITLTYIQQTGDTLAGGAGADGGDRYIGLDEFGRVVDQNYIDSSGTSVDRFQYAYDADGNVLYKNNLLNVAGTTLYHSDSTSSGDDASAYDALNRMTYYVSGYALSASGNNGSFLDTTGGATGTAITYDALGNATAVGSSNYTYNAQNQISGSGSPTYDNNGNTTLEAGSTYVYDGWNRLISINTAAEAFQYDAQGRQIYEAQDGENRYYDSAGQVIQETGAAAQYVWGLGYVNDMVLRDDGYFGGGNLGKSSSGLGERLYVEQDADWDLTSLSDDTGAVVQHIIYNDPFGNNVTGVTGDWSGYEGFYSSPYLFAFGFQGGRSDTTGLWQFGVREYDPSSAAGRWMQEEPFGARYIDGMNLYQFEGENPVDRTDSSGLSITINNPGLQYAQQVRDGLQRIIGNCYTLSLKPNLTPLINVSSPSHNGGLPLPQMQIVTSYTLQLGPKNPNCNPGCSACATYLEKAVNDSRNFRINWTPNNFDSWTDGNDVYVPSIFYPATPEIGPGGQIIPVVGPWEVGLWHELMGHAWQDYAHYNPLDPNVLQNQPSYDNAVRMENMARQCLQNQGYNVGQRRHTYYP
jgi:RHS repeat-associated protein